MAPSLDGAAGSSRRRRDSNPAGRRGSHLRPRGGSHGSHGRHGAHTQALPPSPPHPDQGRTSHIMVLISDGNLETDAQA